MTERVDIGDAVYDIGCVLTQRLRESGNAPPAKVVRVKQIFPWGLRVCDPADHSDEWDCEHWERAGP